MNLTYYDLRLKYSDPILDCNSKYCKYSQYALSKKTNKKNIETDIRMTAAI